MVTGAISSNRTNGANFEASDSKPMPTCYVEAECGPKWNSKEENKSYSSYNVGYLTSAPPLAAESLKNLPFRVQVGMGINTRLAPPQISFVHRNQVPIWVVDPAFRGQIHGIMSFFDDIKEKEQLDIYEDATVELGSLKVPQARMEEHSLERISLSIAQLQSPPAFNVGSLDRSLTEIRPHEYLARGWDATKNEWREVLWPELDKEFRAADHFGGKSPVWNIKCQWKEAREAKEATTPTKTKVVL
ncbi:hypothetical protein K438DRAFT_913041 [Mycena galopus ATCC 62051]|nr:hypothetical protein K438DRAFT_913041 [Mycena galopus ATCC 62051]